MVIEKTWVDKSKWGDGPWMTEPDKVQWTDEETGLDCLARRNSQGVICGYVGIPETHPAFGIEYSFNWDEEKSIIQNAIEDLDVHGGLTFSGACNETDKEHGICHITEDGKDKVWWFGFDTDHGDDYAPARESILSSIHFVTPSNDASLYKTLDYVKNEFKKLAKQLKDLQHG